MVLTTRVEVEDDRPVVVKRAPAADAARLQGEAERLRRARHPGVVAVRRSGPEGQGWVLCTGHAGRPVATLGLLTVAQVASLVAAVATTLADLHDLGVVHGRLDGTHVLVGEEGRPVLCGFGDGEVPAGPEDDVAALGALLVQLLGTDETGEPIPERRWRAPRRWTGWDRRALLLLADQAAADPPTCRPTARRLAAEIAAAVPGAAPLVVVDGEAPERPESVEVRPIERRRAAIVALVGVLLLVLGARRLATDAPASGPRTTHAPPFAAGPAARAEVHTATPIAGGALEAGGRHYRVGQAGDAILVADWDCDGTATPALLRPSTGEVFVFPRWTTDGRLAVEPVARVPDARALLSERSARRCPSLVVRTATGALVPVREAAG